MEASRQIMRIFESYTPHVQPLSIDEAFLDVTGSLRLFGDGKRIAEKIRADIQEKIQLTASVGVASNMFLAKIASDQNKPDGITVVPFDQKGIEAFLAPLPIGRMWGVGKVTQKKLLALGIPSLGKLQTYDLHRLEIAIGSRAAQLFSRLAHGIDERGIAGEVDEKSISNEITFKKDATDGSKLKATYKRLIDKVGGRLRKADFLPPRCILKFVGTTSPPSHARPASPSRPATTPPCAKVGMELLNEHLRQRPVRLIGFGTSG